jgi:hypothetical protein
MSLPLNLGFSRKEIKFPATSTTVFDFGPNDTSKNVEYVLNFPTSGAEQITDINTFVFTFAND